MVVANNLLPGGAERVIVQLLNNWSLNDIECSLVVINKTEHYYTLSDKINLYEIDQVSKNQIFNKLGKYEKVRKLAIKLHPDIVLSLPEEIGIYVIGALKGTGIPVVVSERNNPWVMPNKKVTRALRKLLYPSASGLIFQTRQAASFFSEKLQKNGIVLPNPLDLSRIPMPYMGEREKIIVGAGRLEPQKNFHLLIDAFTRFYKTHLDYKLEIYGEGSLRQELESYAKSKIPEGNFAFLGRVTDLPERMRKCAAFVLSSDFEGVPNVLIEAMAMGVPSVATDCAPGGAAELIEDGVNGFVVPIGDAERLSNKITEVVDNIGLAKNFSVESVKIKKRLDANIVCREWLNFLIKCANANKNS